MQPGVIFDLRSALIALAGSFGGFTAALIAAGMSAAFRVLLAGLVGIVCASCVVGGGHLPMRGSGPAFGHLLGFAACVSAAAAASFLALPALRKFGAGIGLLTFPATGAAAILHMLEPDAERELLRAALAQAPDFQFVKKRRGEFVAVNQTVASHNGFRRPADLRWLRLRSCRETRAS